MCSVSYSSALGLVFPTALLLALGPAIITAPAAVIFLLALFLGSGGLPVFHLYRFYQRLSCPGAVLLVSGRAALVLFLRLGVPALGFAAFGRSVPAFRLLGLALALGSLCSGFSCPASLAPAAVVLFLLGLLFPDHGLAHRFRHQHGHRPTVRLLFLFLLSGYALRGYHHFP